MRARIEEAGIADRVLLDSCGTGAWHVGKAPDRRSVAVAASHGIDLSDLRARKVAREDFSRFDLILAMDQSNLNDLESLMPQDSSAHLALYRDYCGQGWQDVPDPYYGGSDGFEVVYQMIDQASGHLLRTLRKVL